MFVCLFVCLFVPVYLFWSFFYFLAYLFNIFFLVNVCRNYQTLSDAERKYDYLTVIAKCDISLNGWYRFQGAAGTQMATTCPPRNRCDAAFPGWLSDAHPTVADGIVTRRVCFHTWRDCCMVFSTRYIQVKNCSSYYVYRLRPVPGCPARYCGSD